MLPKNFYHTVEKTVLTWIPCAASAQSACVSIKRHHGLPISRHYIRHLYVLHTTGRIGPDEMLAKRRCTRVLFFLVLPIFSVCVWERRCWENHFSRQATLQKAVLLSLASVTSTNVPHCRHVKLRCMTTDCTYLECFQYSRSQWAEQNFVRLSAPSVTRTRRPHFRHRKTRREGFFRGARTWLLAPCRWAYRRQKALQYFCVMRSAVYSLPHTGQIACRFICAPRSWLQHSMS